MKSKELSIIIVNWNGKQWLPKCFDSLREQSYRNFKVILVDNASTDGSVQMVRDNYPEIFVIENNKNSGFATGNTIGIKHAKSKYILLLNSDTWLEKDSLNKLVSHIKTKKSDIVGIVGTEYNATKPIPNIPSIDILGHSIHFFSKLDKRKLFYLSGAYLIFEKKLYIETKGLDNDFFMYHEEIDWFWRLHLLNKKIYRATDVLIHHAVSGSTGQGLKHNSFLWRNQNTLQMLLKNYSWYNLLWIIPLYISQNLIEICFFLTIFQPKIAFSYSKGWWFNLKNLKKILIKRKWIQKKRVVSDIVIMKKMYWGFSKFHHLSRYLFKK